MTKSQAQRTILLSGAATIGSTYLRDVSPKDFGGGARAPAVRSLIGGLAAFTMLSFLAALAPSPAANFAVFIAFIALTRNLLPIAEKFFTTP